MAVQQVPAPVVAGKQPDYSDAIVTNNGIGKKKRFHRLK